MKKRKIVLNLTEDEIKLISKGAEINYLWSYSWYKKDTNHMNSMRWYTSSVSTHQNTMMKSGNSSMERETIKTIDLPFQTK